MIGHHHVGMQPLSMMFALPIEDGIFHQACNLRKAAVQAESNEHRMIDNIPMWQTSFIVPHYLWRGFGRWKFSEIGTLAA